MNWEIRAYWGPHLLPLGFAVGRHRPSQAASLISGVPEPRVRLCALKWILLKPCFRFTFSSSKTHRKPEFNHDHQFHLSNPELLCLALLHSFVSSGSCLWCWLEPLRLSVFCGREARSHGSDTAVMKAGQVLHFYARPSHVEQKLLLRCFPERTVQQVSVSSKMCRVSGLRIKCALFQTGLAFKDFPGGCDWLKGHESWSSQRKEQGGEVEVPFLAENWDLSCVWEF